MLKREHLPPKACAQGGCKLASDNRRGAEEDGKEPGGRSGRADAETRTHGDQRQRGRVASAAGPNLLPIGGIVLPVPKRRRRRMKKSNQSRRVSERERSIHVLTVCRDQNQSAVVTDH